MARTSDTNRNVLAGVALFVLVILAFVALMLSVSDSVPAAPMWGLALVVGALVALVALLLLEPVRDADAYTPVATSCTACGKPTLEEWRLCPHCGQMLECRLSVPLREERISG